MDKTDIINLYKMYDFNLLDNGENYLIFSYSNGYFHNVEIVLLEDFDCSELKKEYENVGYAVSIVKQEEIDIIHNRLFEGFFSVSGNKKRIQKEYKEFCDSQTKKLVSIPYEYIKCEYNINGDFSSDSLIDSIFKRLTSDSSQLIILEAAAGFGKTCTSYEVLNCFSKESSLQVPMMTELSRNRKATVFRYVLYSEIDRHFFYLSSNLVENEIKNGRVPLIIDGFDELLSKSIEYDEQKKSFEEVQSMLDTIAELLKNESKAKILITSRKSAIFTGEEFDEWVNKHNLTSTITRIELKTPDIKDWLNSEIIEILSNKGMNLDYISNPLLLSLLKNKDVEYVKNKCVNEIIDDYFNMILTREKERQSLVLTANEQLDILYNLASEFVGFNISSEDTEFIGELIKSIITNNIDDYIDRYKKEGFENLENVPTNEEFVMKLVHHALLDRIVPDKNYIGFINDFVFGYMIGKALELGYIKQPLDYKYVDLICTTYMIFDEQYRSNVMNKISCIFSSYSATQQLEISNKIYRKTITKYSNETISDVFFSNEFNFDNNNNFTNCIFVNCTFKKCIFHNSSFINSQFYNCTFFSPNCDDIEGNNTSLIFLGCAGHEYFAKKVSNTVVESDNSIDYEKTVLEQFWKKGGNSPEPRRAFTTMHKGISEKDIPMIDSAIKSLVQKGILNKLSVCYELNFSKLSDIKTILGR